MIQAEPDQIQSIAGIIRRYLSSCPEASETVEGIARWWLARQRYQDSLELVQHALDYLESQGQVEKVNASKGVVLYRKHQRLDQCS
ncbi:hypothetical protein [Cellvibrio sp. PSBB006]|uniref:hypothetical protein n=1 Tax=Cellvibrio sp. PSBB006 TaxID=1987723 RepID=UPI000B3BAC30|nr:hypothetical protein [Cellvibrio sp. PSBB006]ARU26671.1 hypothetical protein CBR65_04070 [Cellvibrio sp. PSBB006]